MVNRINYGVKVVHYGVKVVHYGVKVVQNKKNEKKFYCI